MISLFFYFLLSFLFTSGEIAILNTLKDWSKKRISHYYKDYNEFMVSVVLGNTISLTLFALILEEILDRIWGFYGIRTQLAETLDIAIISFFTILFCEFIPKNIGLRYSQPLETIGTPLFIVLRKLLAIFIIPITKMQSLFTYSTKKNQREGLRYNFREIIRVLQILYKNQELGEEERHSIYQILRWNHPPVTPYLTHRQDLLFVSPQVTWREVFDQLHQAKKRYASIQDPVESTLLGYISYVQAVLFQKSHPYSTLNDFREEWKPFIGLKTTLSPKRMNQMFLESKSEVGLLYSRQGDVLGSIFIHSFYEDFLQENPSFPFSPKKSEKEEEALSFPILKRGDKRMTIDPRKCLMSQLYQAIDLVWDEEEDKTFIQYFYQHCDRIPEEGEKILLPSFLCWIEKKKHQEIIRIDIEYIPQEEES